VTFVHELRVRYGECDPQGIVFNANYLLYFDVAFTEYWRDRVGPWDEMADFGVDAVVAEANLSFRAPARFDDVLQLEVTTEELGTTSTTTRVDIRRDGELLVEARLRHVFVDRQSWAKTTMPEAIRERLAAPAS
jgi:acyl-CoA thioester hydrolase